MDKIRLMYLEITRFSMMIQLKSIYSTIRVQETGLETINVTQRYD